MTCAAALNIAGAILGAAFLAIGAQIDLPIHPVPMSLQSLALVLVAAFLTPPFAALSVALYLAAGAFGLPVFAGGAHGAAHLIGPTAGYLWGFLIAAVVASGLIHRRWGRTFALTLAAMLIGHAIILGLGAARLALLMPFDQALEAGLEPFLLGALVKSAAAAAICSVWRLTRHGVRPRTN